MANPPSIHTKKEMLHRSWQRCYKIGLKPDEKPSSDLLTILSVKELTSQNHTLINTARKVMQSFVYFLEEHGYSLFLLNNEGRILEKFGSLGQDNREEMAIGVSWREHLRGTNAVSLTLEYQVPIFLHGDEHFFMVNRALTCAASPIKGTDGELKAIINLCSDRLNMDGNALSISFFIAEQIEQELAKQEKLIDQQTLYKYRQENQLSSVRYSFSQLIHRCVKMEQVVTLGKKAAKSNHSILILGQSGTGKEVLAQSIHAASSRANKPFVAINCSALPDNLVESELFGYKGGAFTGANKAGSLGKFRAANRGTLFLDEIGDMSLKAQSSLLRVLQEREVMPVGDQQTYPIDVRILAATHRNLEEEVEQGRFRADLYYRLQQIIIDLPALAERNDLLFLAEYFLQQEGKKMSKKAAEKLLSYPFPGNIRQLKSIISQAAFLAENEQIEPEHIRLPRMKRQLNVETSPVKIQTLREAEMQLIHQSLQLAQGNISVAAKTLGISRNTFYRKMEAYQIF